MIELIPAIDIIDGKCVRLTQGDYSKKTVFYDNPLEVAKMFAGAGIGRLHVVDLDGAKAGKIINYNILEQIAVQTDLVIDFGGGLKSDNDLRIAFESGASMVTGGSIAVKDPELFESWLREFGNNKIILGADVKDENIAIHGWTETTDINLFDFLSKYIDKGIRKVICTDISKDGMLEGTSIELYKRVVRTHPEAYLIASGGVASMDDIKKLEEAEIPAVIFGKAFYEGHISLKELEKFIVR